MHPLHEQMRQSRRQFFTSASGGIGLLALASMLRDDGLLADEAGRSDPLAPRAYSLVIRCEATCYERERGDIEVVTGSWTIDP